MLSPRSLILFSLLVVARPALAQVTYTDMEPDITITTWDAHFLQIGPGTGDGLYLWKHPNEVVVNSLSSNVQVLFAGEDPAVLEYGQTIDRGGIWRKPNYSVLNHEGSTGNWIGVEDGYLAMRYKQDGAWHYAWARLDVDGAPTLFTLKDYAVELTAEVPIVAGAEATASVEPSSHHPLYTLSGQKLTVPKRSYVAVQSTLGIQLFRGWLAANETVDLSTLGGGCMFVRVRTAADVVMLKVIVGD